MRRLSIFFWLMLTLPALFAFDWPVKEVTLTATFGEHRGDHFHTGIDLGGGEQRITPISSGEVIFSYEAERDYSSIPVGLGNFTVLRHQGGILSVYGHLKKNSLDRQKTVYDAGEQIGLVGDSGYSLGKHLHLTIIDSEMNTIINPLLLLPSLKDTQFPVIKRIYFKRGKEIKEIKTGARVNQGEAELLIELYDLREDVAYIWEYAPYKILLYQDGQEVLNITFDSLKGRGGRMFLTDSEKQFRDVYADRWIYRLGSVKLLAGVTTLSIFVDDFSGNESSREILLEVIDR